MSRESLTQTEQRALSRRLSKLGSSQRARISTALTPKLTKYIRIEPFPKQTAFLLLDNVQEVLYGGAGFGGKTLSLLAAALQYVDAPNYHALLLRRTYGELTKPDGLLELAGRWLGGTDATWNGLSKSYKFPIGSSLTFGYMDAERDKFTYQGTNWQYIGFDEITQMLQNQYQFLFGWLRKTEEMKIPLRMRGATNPVGPGRLWVKQYFIDEGPTHGRVFIPAMVDDNPYANKEAYRESLNKLDPITREQILHGNWEAQASGKFRRHWFNKFADAVPADTAFVRYWDLAACLIAGTMIETDRGHIPIEEVATGDTVMTQSGFRRVERSYLSGYVNELVTVLFSDGSNVTGTSNHPIYVQGGYWIGLGDLMGSDRILHRSELVSWQTRETHPWKKNISIDDGTFVNQGGAIITAMNGIRERRSIFTTHSIEKSGNRSTARFPLATISTTKTTTATITKLTIWNASPRAIIVKSIGEIQNLENQCDVSFIETLKHFAQRHWKLIKNQSNIIVPLVAENFHQQAIAVNFASEQIVDRPALVRASAPAGVPVYDLIVEDAHAFFANDILVHNTEPAPGKDPSWTVGALVGIHEDERSGFKRFFVADLQRDRLTPKGVEDLVFQTAEMDGTDVAIRMEQEPGSSGVDVVNRYQSLLAKYDFRPDKVTGPKEIRANAFASQAEAGNVFILKGRSWLNDMLDEFSVFPGGGHDDIVVSIVGAYNCLVSRNSLDIGEMISNNMDIPDRTRPPSLW